MITRTFTENRHGFETTHEAYTEDGGLTWRWTSNDRYCPLDACQEIGIPCNYRAQEKAIDEDFAKFLEDYQANYEGPSDEERAEARAAHGPGVKLVNVFTGDTWTT